MSDIAALIASTAALMTPIGAAVAWLWHKVEKRMAACEAAELAAKETVRRLTFEVRRDGQAVRLLFTELHTLDPRNPTLLNVAAVLRMQYQPELALPDDMTDLLARIEHPGVHEHTRES